LDNVYVAGWSYDSVTRNNFATIKYAPTFPSPIPLQVQNAVSGAVLSWDDPSFGLQSAPTLTDTFTNIPGATSPYTNPITGAQQFFRLKLN
jgi:hypothetical protein